MATPAPEAPPVEEPVAPAAPETTSTEPTPSTAEADANRRAAEAERKTKRLEDQAKKRDEDEAKKQGEWQKLAEQREQELAEARSTTERVAAEARITRLATKAKFIDPVDAIGKVKPDEATDDAAIETALEKIASQSPHLIAKEAPAVPEIGQVLTPSATPDPGPTPPQGKLPLRTQADVEALSDKEFQDRYDEVQAVLRSTTQ